MPPPGVADTSRAGGAGAGAPARGELPSVWRAPGSTPRRPAFVGVVVPACDEEAEVGGCMEAIAAAFDHPDLASLPRLVVTVLDSCSDDTGARATAARRASGLEVVEVRTRNVGAARRAGFERVLRAADGLDPSEVWLATTDADSRVGPEWLARQIAWSRSGAEAVAGTVSLRGWDDHAAATKRRYGSQMAALGTGGGHPHVYGANLSFSAAAYLSAGGVPPVPTGEDHALWRALRDAGRRTVSVGDLSVATSSRREARAPLGFGHLLETLARRRRECGERPGP